MAWQIYELTNSALQIGFIGLVRAVPQIAMLMFGGLLAASSVGGALTSHLAPSIAASADGSWLVLWRSDAVALSMVDYLVRGVAARRGRVDPRHRPEDDREVPPG